MKIIPTLSALALAIASVAANAVTTYLLDFQGTSVHFRNAFECPGFICEPPAVFSPFIGTLTLTAPDGDGTFTFDGSTSPGNLTLTLGQFGHSTPLELGNLGHPLFGAVISGGQVTALTGSAQQFDGTGPTTWLFADMTTDVTDPASTHQGPTNSHAVIMAAVPEPETWALLVAGLGAGGMARRRGSSPKRAANTGSSLK
jgi:hypothetical protein